MPLFASRRRPSSAADLWGPSARWRLLGCVGDGLAAGHRRRISDAPKLVARACRHAAARSGVMLGGTKKRLVPLLRHGQWSRSWVRVRHDVGDGSSAGHRRQYGAAPMLAVLAGGPAAARAVALLSGIRPGQSPRLGYWSRVRRGARRDWGDGSLPVRHWRLSGLKAPSVQIGPTKAVPGTWVLLSVLICSGGRALVEWGDERLSRGPGKVLGSLRVGVQNV